MHPTCKCYYNPMVTIQTTNIDLMFGRTKELKRKNGEWAMLGAKQGADFGQQYKDDEKTLNLINDFDWLKETFDDAV